MVEALLAKAPFQPYDPLSHVSSNIVHTEKQGLPTSNILLQLQFSSDAADQPHLHK
jgi:hypothetical protein